ncbi:Transcriptional regulator TrmB protein [Halorhabdus tiamatea SARL4B]|uniref:Transcriptional regulator TrmB protein n=1 Tax=Halorhabdus tiamatea SARL4B TaxID=1033806 RepID=U2FEV4_9EURY|nr:TrmB family transcriptional regulator sugar-binding domain-containing protein [Halorhabdus tiamatea]ERJ06814.1 Transcriptional regulator TrmB protein [Halorhabdus tiamatea SARL4B]
MNESELTSILEEAGFSPYQADAYVALLELGSATATDLAEESDVPDPRIYDVLRDLEKAGYVETYEQDSLRARVHDFEALQESLDDRATRFSRAVDEIERRWEKPRMEESVVNVVTRFETVLESAAEAIENAENQIQLTVNPDTFEVLRPALRAATDNGVAVNLAITTDGESESVPDPETVADVCTEARHRELSSPFVAIVDRKKAYFAPHEGSTNEYGLIVDDQTHAYVFYWFFLTTQWDNWEPVVAAEDDTQEYLEIRYCIRDIAPLIDDGKTVRLRVDGADTETGDRRVIEGTVKDVIVGPDHVNLETTPISSYGDRVAIVLETDDGTVDVGGWGALVEDVEAHRIVVESVE